jgi:hypothetical protein
VTPPSRLAAALAARLAPVSLPSRVTEEWLLDQIAPVAGEDVAGAAREALVAVQEAMVEATDLPWPEPYPDWSAGPPRPGVRVEGDVLRLWYGDETRPVLELEPLPLADLD